VVFDARQRWWLDRIVGVIAQSAGVTADDLDTVPFTERGGIDGAVDVFGERIATLLDELNQELTA
jgi:type I restriction enzyme R subunit